MKALFAVKSTGENFIRHYYPAIRDMHTAYNKPGNVISAIQSYRPDVVLFEWADSLAANTINILPFQQAKDKFKFKVIVRLHDHEVTREDQIAKNISWQHVDAVWFINRKVQRLFQEQVNSRVSTFFISNAVNPALFEMNEKSSKKAGLLSIWFRHRKGIDRLAHLARACPDWSFHVRVHVPEFHERFYMHYAEVKKIAPDNLVFEHRDANKMVKAGYDYADVREWWKDKAVVISSSRAEGYHYIISEGSLTGSMPIVWNWPTATDFWKPYVVPSVNEAAARLNAYRPGREGEYRAYIETNYSPHVLWPRVVGKINAL